MRNIKKLDEDTLVYVIELLFRNGEYESIETICGLLEESNKIKRTLLRSRNNLTRCNLKKKVGMDK